MNLDRVAEGGSVDAVVAAALARVPFTVRPIFEDAEDGSRVIVIPTEAGYSITRFLPAPSA
jgi:hypothetical protein